MFGFQLRARVTETFAELNRRVDPAFGKRAEELYSKATVESLLRLSGDVRTAVELTLLSWESNLAVRMAEAAEYDAIARELVEFADAKGVSAQSVVTSESEGYVDAAKEFAENLAKMLDSGEIVGSPAVRQFAAEKGTAMLSGWMLYRMRLQSAYEKIAAAAPLHL
jgi:hypothetical protein